MPRNPTASAASARVARRLGPGGGEAVIYVYTGVDDEDANRVIDTGDDDDDEAQKSDGRRPGNSAPAMQRVKTTSRSRWYAVIVPQPRNGSCSDRRRVRGSRGTDGRGLSFSSHVEGDGGGGGVMQPRNEDGEEQEEGEGRREGLGGEEGGNTDRGVEAGARAAGGILARRRPGTNEDASAAASSCAIFDPASVDKA